MFALVLNNSQLDGGVTLDIDIKTTEGIVPDQAKEYATKKVSKIGKIFDRVGGVHVFLGNREIHGRPHGTARVVAHLDTGSVLVAEEEHSDLRAAIDLVSEKIERQVRKEKEKLIDRNRRGPSLKEELSNPEEEPEGPPED